jgi:hypothetical protein
MRVVPKSLIVTYYKINNFDLDYKINGFDIQ